jgi:hypothetical protein
MASKKRCERAFGVLRPYGVNPLDIYHQRVARLDSIHASVRCRLWTMICQDRRKIRE